MLCLLDFPNPTKMRGFDMAMKDISDLQVCAAVQAFKDCNMEGPWPYEFLAQETKHPEKVCYRAMERAYKRGYIEYGVSLRSGWLTEKGLQLIGLTIRK